MKKILTLLLALVLISPACFAKTTIYIGAPSISIGGQIPVYHHNSRFFAPPPPLPHAYHGNFHKPKPVMIYSPSIRFTHRRHNGLIITNTPFRMFF